MTPVPALLAAALPGDPRVVAHARAVHRIARFPMGRASRRCATGPRSTQRSPPPSADAAEWAGSPPARSVHGACGWRSRTAGGLHGRVGIRTRLHSAIRAPLSGRRLGYVRVGRMPRPVDDLWRISVAYLSLPLQELLVRFHRAPVVRGTTPITVCPECGQEQVRKIYSAVPIEFKGSGFYRTDGASQVVGQVTERHGRCG